MSPGAAQMFLPRTEKAPRHQPLKGGKRPPFCIAKPPLFRWLQTPATQTPCSPFFGPRTRVVLS
jgi:hypothetical protein